MKTMQDYILEQPEILQRLTEMEYIAAIKKQLDTDNITDNVPVRKLAMIASGTSYNAAVTASHYITLPLDIIYPYEFNMYYELQSYPDDTLFIFISQSGESIETYKALDSVRKHYKTIALTTEKKSTIGKHAQSCLLFGCGEETVIYRTKGFTSSLITLIILGKILAQDHSVTTLSQAMPGKSQLTDFIQKSNTFFNQHNHMLSQATAFFFISSGKNSIIAHEAALKAIETIRLPAMPYELEEVVHGPQNAITATTHIVIIENKEDKQRKAWQLFVALRKLDKQAYFIAAHTHNAFNSFVLLRPDCEIDELFTICALQQFCYNTSKLLGVDLTQRGFPELSQYIKKTF